MTIRNQYLFTQAYLDQVMADPTHDEAAATLAQGLSDWAAFRDDTSLSTLIDSWVGPVLDILGFHHQGVEGQPGLERLYADFTAQRLLGICLTVPPGADIDSTIKGAHYAFQIIAALQEEGCTWGVLTDGSRWRVVKADVLRPYETYLEVDLGQMGPRPPAETVRSLHAFFQRDAFLADEEGKTGLDAHLSRSEEVAEAIQKHLKNKMESVLGALCRGFVLADGRESYTEEQRAEIFDNATYLLYRILFILYAEARGLLPVGNPAYDEIGMQRLVAQAIRYHKEGVPDPASTTLWDGLRRLSQAIYESDEARGVPAYNGGLFSDEDTDDFSKGYLRDCFINDPHLARALFDLTRMRNTNTLDGHKAIDYRDLSVRALGGLYEGMLEYKLFLAEEKMYGIPDRKGGCQYKPATQVERPKRTYREIDAGDVYFAHSPTQRKATGSYYTPEYIVDYIVKETVERGLRERREPLEAKLTDWLGEVAGALDDAERIRLQKAVDRELLHFVEKEVLTFRVCDPAMGSGHFLVNAAHTIANFIVETLNLTPWENAGLDSDPLRWRRRLVESCIYGVDLNPLAVELAKLSLWLATVGEGKPLNFLDHHLKLGNSLIGAWVEALGSPPASKKRVRLTDIEEVSARQMNLLEQRLNEKLPVVLGKVLEISGRPTEKLEDIRGKEAAERAIKELRAPFKAVADLWVSTYFGNEVKPAEYDEALEHIGEPKKLLALPAIQRAVEIAEEKRFFHWELEFPEVFYEDSRRRHDPGFDAAVGNPPYLSFSGRQKVTGLEDEIAYWRASVGSPGWVASHGLFIDIGVRLLGTLGRFSMIVPDQVGHLGSYLYLREWIMKKTTIQSVWYVGEDVFEEVVTPSLVFVTEKSEWGKAGQFTLIDRDGSTHQVAIQRILDDPRLLWQMEPCAALFDELEKSSIHLRENFRDPGVHTGNCSKKLILAEETDPMSVPIREGKDISRYRLSPPSLYINLSYQPQRGEYFTIRSANIYTKASILIRQTAAEIIAAPHLSRTYFRNSVLAYYRLDTPVDDRFMLALLNSRLLNWYYKSRFREASQRAFPQVKVSYLRQLPIRSISFSMSVSDRATALEEARLLVDAYLDVLVSA